MKKKLRIEQLKVQSFVTTAPASKIAGGGTLFDCRTPEPTDFSCYQYISCNPTACIIRSWQEPCVQSALDICH